MQSLNEGESRHEVPSDLNLTPQALGSSLLYIYIPP